MKFLTAPVSLIWRHRRILRAVISSELKARYAGSFLGMLWLVVYPMLFLATYAVVYLFIFKIRPINVGLNAVEFVTLIFCGLIPFISFAECLATGTTAVSSSPHLMKNTLFPIALLPVKVVLCAQVVQITGFAMLTAAVLVLHQAGLASHTITVQYPWLFIIWVFQILFSMGLIWVLSAANVFVRDLGQVIGLVNLILMMLSPIAWTEEMMRRAFQDAPALLLGLLKLNPLYYMIISYQRAILMDQPPSAFLLGTFAIAAVAFFLLGYRVFATLQQVFIENV